MTWTRPADVRVWVQACVPARYLAEWRSFAQPACPDQRTFMPFKHLTICATTAHAPPPYDMHTQIQVRETNSAAAATAHTFPISHAHTHTQPHTYIHTHAHTRTHTHARTHTRTHAHTHARTRTHLLPPTRTVVLGAVHPAGGGGAGGQARHGDAVPCHGQRAPPEGPHPR